MLKLGTVFSGIGAIEHALERMGIPHEISFACDNGGINIFEKNISKDYFSVNSAVAELEDYIKTINLNKIQDFNAVNISAQMETIFELSEEIKNTLNEITNLIHLDEVIEGAISHFYDVVYKQYYNEKGECSINSLPKALQPHLSNDTNARLDLQIVSDILKFLDKNDDFDTNGAKEQLKNLKKTTPFKTYNRILTEIIDEINMFYERIQTAEVHQDLSRISSFKEKKAYVDKLYASKEKSNYVWQTYKANYNISQENLHWNVSFLDGRAYENQIDLFVGGSPCQSFSMVGKRRGLEDTRGTLFYEYARLIKEIKPKVFIYENVRGLLSHDNGNTWSVMQDVFDELGYTWSSQVLNAKDYGTPQNRDRIFVVGIRNDLELTSAYKFPGKIPLEKTMQDFLIENAPGRYFLNSKGVDFVTKEKNLTKSFTQINGEIQLCQKANQQFNWHGDFVFVEENDEKIDLMEELDKYFLSQKVTKYVLSSGTKDFYSKPEIDLKVARPLLTTMHKMHRAGVDNYVTTEGRIRKLTPRECLRLMGFCDSFKITVSDTQMYKQAGNSIVVDVLIGIVREICTAFPEFTYGGPYKYKKIKFEQLELV